MCGSWKEMEAGELTLPFQFFSIFSTGFDSDEALSKLAHGTVAAFCRNQGVHSIRAKTPESWNDQLLEQARKRLTQMWDVLQKWMVLQRSDFSRRDDESFRELIEALPSKSVHIEPYILTRR
jgi:hypothetical protein